MTRNVKWLDRLEESIIATTIAAATLIIFAAVVHRYGLSNLAKLVHLAKDSGYPDLAATLKSLFLKLATVRLTWAQELCIFLFIWMAKFGAAYGVRTGIHVGVDLLVNALSESRRRALILSGLMGGVLFTGLIGALGARFVWHIAQTGQTSPVLEAPMWLVYLCVPLGSFLMCYRFLEVAWDFARTGSLPRHEPLHVAGLHPEDGGRSS